MHECPDCGRVCYCDLDDSNDCREDEECFHGCDPEDLLDEPDDMDDPEVHSFPAPSATPTPPTKEPNDE